MTEVTRIREAPPAPLIAGEGPHVSGVMGAWSSRECVEDVAWMLRGRMIERADGAFVVRCACCAVTPFRSCYEADEASVHGE